MAGYSKYHNSRTQLSESAVERPQWRCYDKGGMKIKTFSLIRYLEQALRQAEYASDEDGLVVASVVGAAGFYSQGTSVEEARENLRDVIEGNVLLALQLGLPIPEIEGIEITERNVGRSRREYGKAHASKTARNRA